MKKLTLFVASVFLATVLMVPAVLAQGGSNSGPSAPPPPPPPTKPIVIDIVLGIVAAIY